MKRSREASEAPKPPTGAKKILNACAQVVLEALEQHLIPDIARSVLDFTEQATHADRVSPTTELLAPCAQGCTAHHVLCLRYEAKARCSCLLSDDPGEYCSGQSRNDETDFYHELEKPVTFFCHLTAFSVEQRMGRHSCYTKGDPLPCGTPFPPNWVFKFYGSAPKGGTRCDFQQLDYRSTHPAVIQDVIFEEPHPVSPRLSRLLQDKCKEFWL